MIEISHQEYITHPEVFQAGDGHIILCQNLALPIQHLWTVKQHGKNSDQGDGLSPEFFMKFHQYL